MRKNWEKLKIVLKKKMFNFLRSRGKKMTKFTFIVSWVSNTYTYIYINIFIYFFTTIIALYADTQLLLINDKCITVSKTSSSRIHYTATSHYKRFVLNAIWNSARRECVSPADRLFPFFFLILITLTEKNPLYYNIIRSVIYYASEN